MLSMPRIVRPDPFSGIGSPVDPALAGSLSETKNCWNLKSVGGCVKSDRAGRDTTFSISAYILELKK